MLEYTLGGKNISEVLAMSVAEAEEFFGDGEANTPAAHKILDRLADVGLGYLSLGQPLTTLSGGERQRLKLATQMAEKGDVYVLDEPTTGLHLADVEHLLGLLDRLVDSGKSVIVIEHHQAVMAHADWIIDLGPGAGHDGGRIVFEGTPADLVADRSTLTGEHLAAYVVALFNEIRANNAFMVCSGAVAPAVLPVREDLRTRMGWGLIYQIHGLSDDEKVAALSAAASARGLTLSPGVLPYLLSHFRRDMRSLSTMLDSLDQYSLETQRPITLPLLRDWLQAEAKE